MRSLCFYHPWGSLIYSQSLSWLAGSVCPSPLRPWAHRSLKSLSHSLPASNRLSHSIHNCFPLSQKGHLAQLLQSKPTYRPRPNPIPPEVHSDLQKALCTAFAGNSRRVRFRTLSTSLNILNMKACHSLPTSVSYKTRVNYLETEEIAQLSREKCVSLPSTTNRAKHLQYFYWSQQDLLSFIYSEQLYLLL